MMGDTSVKSQKTSKQIKAEIQEINMSIDAQERKIYECKKHRAELLCQLAEAENREKDNDR